MRDKLLNTVLILMVMVTVFVAHLSYYLFFRYAVKKVVFEMVDEKYLKAKQ